MGEKATQNEVEDVKNDVDSKDQIDRMAEVEKIKQQANEKFKEGDYFSAKCLWSGGLEMLERCCLHLPGADEYWETLKNNMVMADLKRGEWTRVIDATTEILTRNPQNAKALYRRGIAKLETGKFEEARRDFRMMLDVDPNNADAQRKLDETNKRIKLKKSSEKEQAEKMKGFLRGERLDDLLEVSEDGGVRKITSNDNMPLISSWIKRAWLEPDSSIKGVVTCHIVLKDLAGKEIYSSRRPPNEGSKPPPGPQSVGQPTPAKQPIMPQRWILGDENVFRGWNAAVRCMELREIGKFEIQKFSLGPTVEPAIQATIAKWMPDTPERREMFHEYPPEMVGTMNRRAAVQILGLPEELCGQEDKPNDFLKMEIELLDIDEFMDLDGDGRIFIRIIKEGKRKGATVVEELSEVTAHFRIAKMLPNHAVKDTKMGLCREDDEIVMKEDKNKVPVDFIVGEEDAEAEGRYIPPCIGDILMKPPGGAVEGLEFEMIFKDGLPISDMEKSVHDAWATGCFNAMPNTTGPVYARVAVEKVVAPMQGPGTTGWKGMETCQKERIRAEELLSRDGDRHASKAIRRYRRVLVWFEQILEGRKWKVSPEENVGDSMYDLEWDDEDDDDEPVPAKTAAPTKKEVVQKMPEMLEPENALVSTLLEDEMREWAKVHASVGKLLITSDPELSEKHAKCAVQAARIGKVDKEDALSARETLAHHFMEQKKPTEAIDMLNSALAIDRTNQTIKDKLALATQQKDDRNRGDMKNALKLLKQDIAEALESQDWSGLMMLLEEIESLPLTWEAIMETKVGKEVGLCAKVDNEAVKERAKTLIGRLHTLAKQQRPQWVR